VSLFQPSINFAPAPPSLVSLPPPLPPPVPSTQWNGVASLALQHDWNTAEGLHARSGEALRQAGKARHTLAAVAAVQALAFVALMFRGSDGGWPPDARVAAGSAAFMTMLYFGLSRWARVAPLPAAIVGLAMHLTLWWTGFVYAWALVERRFGDDVARDVMRCDLLTLPKLLILIAFIRAVVAGARHRRLRAAFRQARSTTPPPLPLSPDAPARRLTGVGSAMALYVVLLYLCINMTANWGDGELTPSLYARLIGVNAIVVGTWAIACWRDVLRPLLRPVGVKWYVMSVPLGALTFLLATGWLYAVRAWAGVGGEVPGDDSTFSWEMKLLLSAVAPALVEEVAFRGAMFAGFARWLSDRETVIVTALMFMVLHVNVPAFPHLLAGGLLLGFVRLRTGSWVPCVFIHFTHNFLCLLAAG
jgi:membrane protease YdiL (CAAX protease family)